MFRYIHWSLAICLVMVMLSPLAGDVLNFDGSSNIVAFEKYKLSIGSWGVHLNVFWVQYSPWMFGGVWLIAMLFLSWVYHKQQGRVRGVVEKGLHVHNKISRV